MKSLLFTAKKRFVLYGLSLALIMFGVIFNEAKAADIASRHIIGFSPDGSYFAFEEYGVQDGSGFPYATIYITQTQKNNWVKNTPVRILIEDETVSLTSAREKALDQASPLLKKLNITHPGRLLAHNPITELNNPKNEVIVAPGTAPFLQQYALTFKLGTVSLPTKRCKDYGPESQKGYVLSVQRKGQDIKTLHKDTRIPTSRRCPKRYIISDVIRYQPDKKEGKALYIVLLQVFSYGFEGDDGRYLATSHWLPNFQAIN